MTNVISTTQINGANIVEVATDNTTSHHLETIMNDLNADVLIF
jgi:hypothetical protein